MKTKIEIPSQLISSKIDGAKAVKITILTLVSSAFIACQYIFEVQSASTTNIVLGSVGYIGLLTAIFMAITQIKCKIHIPTGSKLTFKSVSFNSSDYQSMQSMISRGDIKELLSSSMSAGSSMYVEIAYSKDKQFAAYQFFKYIPYEYTADSDIIYVEADKVANFCV